MGTDDGAWMRERWRVCLEEEPMGLTARLGKEREGKRETEEVAKDWPRAIESAELY